ncbi:MAG: guanylate kinase [Thermodesulfobacteriota bacterium]
MHGVRAMGELFVVSAPSGAGKSTLCRLVCQNVKGVVYSVSHTTRPARVGEVHGLDYFFLDEESFQEMVDRREFLEWAWVHHHRYGTSRGWLMERLEEGLDVILDVDVQGAEQIRASDLPAHFIFVLPPSVEVLRRRLWARGTETSEEIERRLAWARGELSQWERFEFIILNDELAEAAKDLESVIVAQRCRLERKKAWVRERFQHWIPYGK